MKVEVLTLFPEIFSGFLSSSLIGKSIQNGILEVTLTNFREFADPPHFKVDDEPYGGGAGMVLKPEPLIAAIRAAKKRLPQAKVICLTPSGKTLTQESCGTLSQSTELIFVCGRYEGFDQRILDLEVDLEISIGDYVLMGGEVPTMVLLEATVRLIDGAIGNKESIQEESFSSNLLEGPQYTRPQSFEGLDVPEVLRSGDHSKIAEWRRAEARKKTKTNRIDLIKNEH